VSGKGVEIVTFGCRLNTYESEVIRREAGKAGLENAIVVNTCAVTAEATRQARQTIRKLKRENPDARILVTGCAAQVEPETFAEMAEVDAVLGNDEKLHAETYRALPFGLDAQEKVRVNDIMSVRETAGHLLDAQPHEGFGGRARAYLQVQNGCDHRCTFCIIPFGRGPSRSVPMGSVVEEVRRLAENGFREVVITGVDITSYGYDLPGNPRLGDLVGAVLRHVPELPRLRLSSIDSVEADPALLDALASESRLMPHLHLSLQAGHDLTLKRMKRRHLREDAIRFCKEVRARRPDIVFGADLIAGFPTETEEMFEGTLSIVEACDLTHLHVFPFSPRPGTPAARMPQVPRAEIKARAERLRAAGAAALTRHLEAERGRTALVLSERSNFGRTEGFTPVRLENAVVGEILSVRIAGHDGETLVAKRIKEAA
jgi:threonylcarbamoyladenosine tRNA methylthiotransferase MtaB